MPGMLSTHTGARDQSAHTQGGLRRWCFLLPLNLRRAWRSARAKPAFSLTIVGTIALVMCAAGIAFVVFDATVLRALPYPEDDRVVVVYTLPPSVTDPRFRNPLHAVDLLRFRERCQTLADLEGVMVREHTVASAGDPEALPVGHASAGLFPMLGLRMALGRSFTPDEDRNQQKVTVLTHAFWQMSFGGAPDIVGRKILIDGEPHDVVGVLDRRATTPFATARLWRPLGISETNLPLPFATFVLGVGRLAPGASLFDANGEVRLIMASLGKELPKTHDGWNAGVIGLREWQFGDQRYAVAIVMVGAILMLLVAWVNILNLCLADVLGRRTEHAISLAIGATRADLVGTQIVGILVLMAGGAAAGLVLASWVLPMLQTLDRGALGPVGELEVGFRVQLLIGAVTSAAAILAGAVPMARFGRGATQESPDRVLGSWRGRVIRMGLVAAQISAVVVLVSGSLVLGKAVHRMHRSPIGFRPEGVLATQLRMPARLYPTMNDRARAVAAFIESVKALPGVTAVGSVTNPLSPGSAIATQIEVDGMTMPNRQPIPVQFRMISGEYFRALQIPILGGRPLSEQDSATAPPTAIVSRLLGDRFWPGSSPIGRRLRRPLVDPRWITIVGVVDDVSDIRVGQPADGILYVPYAQFNPEIAPVALMVRSDRDVATLTASVRRAILAQSPLQPIFRLQPLEMFVTASFAPHYFRTWALSLMTVIGLALGAVGVYGIVSRTVAERTPEIGLRKALGASDWRALAPGARDTAMAIALGLLTGVPLTFATAHLMGKALPEMDRMDFAVIAVAVMATLLVAVLAAVVPIRRAYRLDPVAALRTV
jgi:putative ABC transport system permease protein